MGYINTFKEHDLTRTAFIETGTNLGHSLMNVALNFNFQILHSIEVFEDNYNYAKNLFKDMPNVHLHLGSSPKILPQIIDPTLPTTFWLDAHFQGNSKKEQDNEYGECPLLQELDAIFAYDWKPVILIDDAQMFDDTRFPKELFDKTQWPTLQQIKDKLPANYQLVEDRNILYCFDSHEFNHDQNL